MMTRRDISTHAEVSVQELVTALKMRFPGNIHIQALPENASGVRFSIEGGTLSVDYIRKGTRDGGSLYLE